MSVRRRVKNGMLVTEQASKSEETLMEAHGLSEYGKFMRLADEGRCQLMLVLNFMLSENCISALGVICQGNNWQRIAFALAVMFHHYEYSYGYIDLRLMKAKGYDQLRRLVGTCVVEVRASEMSFPSGYEKLVNRLFTSQNFPNP